MSMNMTYITFMCLIMFHSFPPLLWTVTPLMARTKVAMNMLYIPNTGLTLFLKYNPPPMMAIHLGVSPNTKCLNSSPTILPSSHPLLYVVIHLGIRSSIFLNSSPSYHLSKVAMNRVNRLFKVLTKCLRSHLPLLMVIHLGANPHTCLGNFHTSHLYKLAMNMMYRAFTDLNNMLISVPLVLEQKTL